MASKVGGPQQSKGEAVVVGKQKVVKAQAGGGNNRRVLGDIGNLGAPNKVHVDGGGKPLTKINRPVTRSLGARLLENAQTQAAAGEKNNKKQVPLPVDGVARKAVAPKKKVIIELKPEEEVIHISPEKVEEKSVGRKGSQDGSLKKKVHTLSAVLTARSKAACGITNRPKDAIIDIDAVDANNQLAAVEYVEDLYKFYKLAESSSHIHDYMNSQPDINGKMRAILVDWLIEVHNKFELTPETLYLTVYIVDRYLSVKAISRRDLQLVGVTAMLIASKYEEIWAPEVNDFVCISDRAYTREQVLVMEKSILGKLEWTLTVPTLYVFLVRFIKAALSDQEMENMVFFLAELGMMHCATIIYCPSMVAAAAVYVARCTLNKSPLWNETLKFHTGYIEPQLMECAKLLVKLQTAAAEHRLQVVYRKYSNPDRSSVSLHTPAKLPMA